MKRNPGWRSALVAVLHDGMRKEFAWGAHDCAIFAADCVRAMTGEDLAETFRGRYTTAAGALRALRKAGYNDLAELVSAKLPEIHPAHARVGDLALTRSEETGWALGVVTGPRIAVLRPEGRGTIGLLDAERAFRV